jgi:hypothetical protein
MFGRATRRRHSQRLCPGSGTVARLTRPPLGGTCAQACVGVNSMLGVYDGDEYGSAGYPACYGLNRLRRSSDSRIWTWKRLSNSSKASTANACEYRFIVTVK